MTAYSNQTRSSLEPETISPKASAYVEKKPGNLTKIKRLDNAIYALQTITEDLTSLMHRISQGDTPEPEGEYPIRQETSLLALLDSGPDAIEEETKEIRGRIEAIKSILFS